MTIFDALTLIGGLCLFLFGMNIMGQALERRAGNKLHDFLGKLTTKKWLGFLTGLGVTAVIQSSSATTVMVVGFVNSGLMNLSQAINVIMGANVGTTVTAWILSLSGIGGGGWMEFLKPTSFTPVLALIGIIFYMFCNSSKKKDTGLILLGFATLMFGMDTMSDAVAELGKSAWFEQLFIAFKNPILAMLAGAILTAIIQSSSASVGILQALSLTGVISYGAVIPIVMGQGIGTCITAMLSSVGANKNAKRAAVTHLAFNVIGTSVYLTAFVLIRSILKPAFFDTIASPLGIAIVQTVFKMLCVLLLLPMSGLLEKLSHIIVRDAKQPEKVTELDDRLLETPSIALERCHDLTVTMADISIKGLKGGLQSLFDLTPDLAKTVRECEDKGDYYEDILGTYLVKLSGRPLGDRESGEASMILRLIGDFERISDHGVGVLESAEELKQKEMSLSTPAYAELRVMAAAVDEIMDLSYRAFAENDLTAAARVEPLEQVIDGLKDQLRARHILRLQQGACTIEAGFIWSDILTDLERAADHCSNIAASVIDMAHHNMNLHESLRAVRSGNDTEYEQQFKAYSEQFSLA